MKDISRYSASTFEKENSNQWVRRPSNFFCIFAMDDLIRLRSIYQCSMKVNGRITIKLVSSSIMLDPHVINSGVKRNVVRIRSVSSHFRWCERQENIHGPRSSNYATKPCKYTYIQQYDNYIFMQLLEFFLINKCYSHIILWSIYLLKCKLDL